MDSATHVLLTGGSAGAVGTFYNADPLVQWMGPAVTTKAAPVSGWFFPAETGDFGGAAAPHKIAWNPPSTYASFVTGTVGGWDNVTFAQYHVEHQKRLNLEYPGGCAEVHASDPFVCDTMDTLYKFIVSDLSIISICRESTQLMDELRACPSVFCIRAVGTTLRDRERV